MIRDSNRVALLAALVSENRLPIANVVDLGIVRDSRAELTGAFKRAIADCDVVLTTGGVSMGAADLVKPLLAEMGKTLSVTNVQISCLLIVLFADQTASLALVTSMFHFLSMPIMN